MSSIKVYFNDKYPRKNGEAAVYIMVHIQYKTVKFNTGITCSVDRWDYKKQRVAGKSKAAKDDNLVIEKAIARVNDVFVRYRLQHKQLTPALLKNEYKNPARRIDFYAFYEEALKERKRELAHGTYRHHKSVMNFLKKYRGELAFSEITPDFLQQFQRWLKSNEGNGTNTVHSKMRIFRTYLNIAAQKGIIEENPFGRIRLKKAVVNRVYLTSNELGKLWEVYEKKKLPPAKIKVLRHFLFMCFTGIRISDLKAVTTDNVMNGMLVFNAYKTKGVKHNFVKVPLSKYALRLIADEGRKSGALFDTISEQKMNTYIKKIAEKAGIDKEITNHSGRHTFATLWLEKTSDLAKLQALLGHSRITDTMVYVHITDSGLKKQMENFGNSIFEKKNPDRQHDPGKTKPN